jgi:Family of unknown function (DUF5681)
MPSRYRKTAKRQLKPPISAHPTHVGYRCPPVETRFKKGQSGNPTGRKPLTLAGLLERALAERMTVRERGRRRKMTKLEAMTRQLIDLAVAGDARIMRLLLNEIRLKESRAAEEPETQDALEAADHDVIAGLLARLRGT